MPQDEVLALKINSQTYEVYTNYPGTVHFDLNTVNNMFFVRDKQLPGGIGYFDKRDFDKFYRALRNPMYFTQFTKCVRIPTDPSELPEVLPPRRIRK